jgi:D-cysteine desulfhydrase
MVAGCLRQMGSSTLLGIGVSRDPADQDPLVPRESVITYGDCWRPKYSVPNARMVEAVQLLARTEAILLDPVDTGKVMAGLIDLVRKGVLRADERVLFLHTGGAPSLSAYEAVLLGREPAAA